MCKCHVWCITKTRTNTKKKTLRSSQGQTERVQKLRIEYWEKVKNIDPEDLVFIDGMGVLLGLTRTHAIRAAVGCMILNHIIEGRK